LYELRRFGLYFFKNVNKEWLIRSLGILFQIFSSLYLNDLCRRLDLYFGKYSLLLREERYLVVVVLPQHTWWWCYHNTPGGGATTPLHRDVSAEKFSGDSTVGPLPQSGPEIKNGKDAPSRSPHRDGSIPVPSGGPKSRDKFPKFAVCSFICQGTSARRQRSDLCGLRVKLPSVTTSLITQR